MSGGAGRDLGRFAVAGMRWSLAARLARIAMTFGTLAVLSRLLDPAAFGTVALVMFVIGLAQMLGDFGARLALVQRPGIDERDRSSVFWFNALLFGLLFAGGLAFAPQIAALLGAPEAAGPLRWTTPIFLMQIAQGVPLAVLERRYDFRSIALADTSGAALGSAVAVALVLLGAGVGALVAQVLVATAVTTAVMVARAGWRPRAVLDLGRLKPLLAYGAYLTGGGLVHFAGHNADRPIVGGQLSPEALGFLTVTQQIVTSPTKLLVQTVKRVMFPVMATLQDDDARLGSAYLRTVHALTVVTAPVFLGIAAVAGPFVDLLLGPGWEPVAVLLVYLSVRALLGALDDVNVTLFQAKGRARFQFLWNATFAVLTVAALLACLPYGLEAIVAGRLALSVLGTPIFAHLALRLVGLGPRALLAAVGAPVAAAAAMAAGVAALEARLALAPAAELAVLVPTGAALYLGLMLALDRRRSLDLVRLALSRG